eukprot:TRINITY_DN28850_c1_g1_i1.p1 TRINITY_DN28850_c1_g1~~TRINITY_DN28850_c1_g1_i1.p1  ORF type:complete len:707 (-),score=157.59 TRINITY_DN28850_c1_g1_i1:8-2128(-)
MTTMKDVSDSPVETKLAKKKKKGAVADPKQSVVAFINEVNSAVSTERRAMVINNLYNMHNAVVNSKFVEFNGIKIISEWFRKAAERNEGLVIECLVHLLSGLPIKKFDLAACDFESSLQSLLEEDDQLVSDTTKRNIQRFLDVAALVQDPRDFVSFLHSEDAGSSSRKRKLNGGIQWLPDSNLVIEASAGDDFSMLVDTSPVESGSSAKRMRIVTPTVTWYKPLVIHIDKESTFESLESVDKENKRIQSALEALYYHPSLIPLNPQGPPVYTFTHSRPRVIDFGPLEVDANTEPKALPEPAPTIQKDQQQSIPSASDSSTPSVTEAPSAASISSLFNNPDFWRVLQQAPKVEPEIPSSSTSSSLPGVVAQDRSRVSAYDSQYSTGPAATASMMPPVAQNSAYGGSSAPPYGSLDSRFASPEQPSYPPRPYGTIGSGPAYSSDHVAPVPVRGPADYYGPAQPMRGAGYGSQPPAARFGAYGTQQPPPLPTQSSSRYPITAPPPPPPTGYPPQRSPAATIGYPRMQAPPQPPASGAMRPTGRFSNQPPPMAMPQSEQQQQQQEYPPMMTMGSQQDSSAAVSSGAGGVLPTAAKYPYPCKFFLMNACKKGAACSFIHEIASSADPTGPSNAPLVNDNRLAAGGGLFGNNNAHAMQDQVLVGGGGGGQQRFPPPQRLQMPIQVPRQMHYVGPQGGISSAAPLRGRNPYVN